MQPTKRQARARSRAKTMRLQRWNGLKFRRSKYVLEDAR
jgi:hypothetical protein